MNRLAVSKMKVLLVDDADTFRQSVAHLLRMRGHEVIEAEDGLAGVKLARAHLPDIIVSDIVMSQVDGYALTSLLRQNAATADIPLVLITGDADLKGMRKGMTLGADDYIAKPFKMEELVAVLDHRVQRRRALHEEMERKLAALGTGIHLGLPTGLKEPLNRILEASHAVALHDPARSAADSTALAESIATAARQLERVAVNLFFHAQLELFGTDAVQRNTLRHAHLAGAETTVAAQASRWAAACGRDADLELKLTPCSAAIAAPFIAKLVEELVANAFQGSAAGTPVSVQCYDDGHNFLLTVVDQGRGMTPELVTKLTQEEPEDRDSLAQKGTGLGLPIVRKLAELHGGKLVLTSEPDKGTTVRVSLPASPPTRATEADE